MIKFGTGGWRAVIAGALHCPPAHLHFTSCGTESDNWAIQAARWQNRDRWPMAETVSKASFCIYLTHLFFLDFLAGRGLSAGTLPPVWGVPVLAAAAFGGGFLVWLVLRRVPVVKTYLI